ncbi:hypothetical protein Tco_0329205 [Tanacetum coccineum]
MLTAGSKEVIDIDVQTEEAEELMVVSSTSRKAAVSENIAKKKTHSPKQPSSTPISKSADDIMAFRKELDALALKHLGPVPATAPTSTTPVNTGSENFNTVFEEVTTGNIEAISPSADHEEEVFSDADDDEMPEIRIYDKSSEGIFDQASYDDDGIITDFNNLPDEVDVTTNPTLRIHNAHPQSQILGDPNTPVQARSSLKKITQAPPYWVEAMQEELLQFKLQQVWVLVDLPNGAKVDGTKWDRAIRLFLAFASFMGFIVIKWMLKVLFNGTIVKRFMSRNLLAFVDPDHLQRSLIGNSKDFLISMLSKRFFKYSRQTNLGLLHYCSHFNNEADMELLQIAVDKCCGFKAIVGLWFQPLTHEYQNPSLIMKAQSAILVKKQSSF